MAKKMQETKHFSWCPVKGEADVYLYFPGCPFKFECSLGRLKFEEWILFALWASDQIWCSRRTLSLFLICAKFSFSSWVTVPTLSGLKQSIHKTEVRIKWEHCSYSEKRFAVCSFINHTLFKGGDQSVEINIFKFVKICQTGLGFDQR